MDRPNGELEVTDEDRTLAGRYAAVIEWAENDGIFVATVPDNPNLHTHGSIREAAATAAYEVTAMWIAGVRETGIPRSLACYSALPPTE